MENYSQYSTLEEFTNGVRAMGRYSFAWEEAKKSLGLSDKALNQALYRLKKRNKLAQIRKGFFAVITPEYSKQGMLPPYLFIDDLMKWLGKRYYVGLFSAAALYGAAHQQPMEYYVITGKSALRDIKNSKLNINFYVKKKWSETDVVQKKTDAGYMDVSIPELTALDLLTYGNFGLNRVVTILEELVEEMKPSVLARTARNFSQTTTIQRLGYIIDKEIGSEKLAAALKKVLNERTIYPVLLLKNASNQGVIDMDWKIVKNTEIESDL